MGAEATEEGEEDKSFGTITWLAEDVSEAVELVCVCGGGDCSVERRRRRNDLLVGEVENVKEVVKEDAGDTFGCDDCGPL